MIFRQTQVSMPTKIDWTDEARADVRRLDKPTARRVFEALLAFARTGQGNVRVLHGDLAGRFRLRVGDWRLILSQLGFTVRVHQVAHRSEAYR